MDIVVGIVSDRPSSGVRIAVERARGAGRGDPGTDAPPWQYDGVASTPEADHAVVGTVDARGEVTVQIAQGDRAAPSPELAQQVRLILRAAYRQALAEGATAPPRRIVRWRGEPSKEGRTSGEPHGG